MRFTLTYRQSTISYLRFGTGKRLLLCFHGFGDRGAIFYNLNKKITDEFTLIALDLPFHGHTDWREKTMQKIDFEAIVNKLLEIENAKKCSLAGFSFGARIVQNLLFSHTDLIEKIYLFAPDGMGTKGLKNATLLPIVVRRFFYFLFKKPTKIVRFVDWLYQKKWVDKSIHWFFTQNIANAERRERLFFYWFSLNDFERKLSDFKKKLQASRIETHVYLGKRDEITPISIGTFLTTDAPNVKLHLIESDHHVLGHL
jgi:pimeloyl-ACP methyl ester carboxylesterase